MHDSHDAGNLMAMHNPIQKLVMVSLADWAFYHHLAKNSDDKVATELLTAVVDVRVDFTFMPHDDLEIS